MDPAVALGLRERALRRRRANAEGLVKLRAEFGVSAARRRAAAKHATQTREFPASPATTASVGSAPASAPASSHPSPAARTAEREFGVG
jgi:hypothetical protein